MNWFGLGREKEIRTIVDTIVLYSVEATETICEISRNELAYSDERQPVSVATFYEVYTEFLFFYVHLLDRYTYPSIAEKARMIMMSDLTHRIADKIVEVIPDQILGSEKIEYLNNISIKILMRNDEYWEFEELMKADISEPSAFKKFGAIISELLGRGSDEGHSIPCQAFVVESLKQMDIKRIARTLASGS